MAMEIKEIRLRHFQELAKAYDSIAAFASAVGSDQEHFRQINRGVRNVGHKTARNIEKKLGKPQGWMDGEDTGASILALLGADKSLLQLIEIYAKLTLDQQHEIISEANRMLGTNSDRQSQAAPFNGVPMGAVRRGMAHAGQKKTAGS